MRIPGGGSGMIPPDLVDNLIKAAGLPIETAKARKQHVVVQKEEIQKLETFLSELDGSLTGLKSKTEFYKMMVESSHPDIIDGTVDAYAMQGSYEFEVRGLAKAEKELAYGFPDKDKSPVGFGYMLVEREGMDPMEVVIEPDSTLQQVATKINDAEAGVRAMVVNTKYKPDSYRLLVISEESGKEARIIIDEDTTFLEFKEQVTGRNLDVLFEDVPITDEDNTLEELIDGVVFFAKRSEPGTRVQVNVTHDLDATVEGIKSFVDKYNQVAKFVYDQFKVDEKTNKAGILAADGSIKSVMRSLQGTFSFPQSTGGKFSTLAQIGISTNPKTGELSMDDAKVKQALAEDYDGVADLFMRSNHGAGVAERMAQKLRNFRDPRSGTVKSRIKTLDRIIKNADQDIERKERQLTKKEESLKRRFANLEGKLSGMQAQSDFLKQRFAKG